MKYRINRKTGDRNDLSDLWRNAPRCEEGYLLPDPFRSRLLKRNLWLVAEASASTAATVTADARSL